MRPLETPGADVARTKRLKCRDSTETYRTDPRTTESGRGAFSFAANDTRDTAAAARGALTAIIAPNETWETAGGLACRIPDEVG